MRRLTRADVLLLVLVSFWLLAAGTALDLAFAAARPCKDNFEGGCGDGRAAAAVISWFCALAGFGIGVVLALVASENRRRRLAAIAWGLAAAPGLYVCYGLVVLAVSM